MNRYLEKIASTTTLGLRTAGKYPAQEVSFTEVPFTEKARRQIRWGRVLGVGGVAVAGGLAGHTVYQKLRDQEQE